MQGLTDGPVKIHLIRLESNETPNQYESEVLRYIHPHSDDVRSELISRGRV